MSRVTWVERGMWIVALGLSVWFAEGVRQEIQGKYTPVTSESVPATTTGRVDVSQGFESGLLCDPLHPAVGCVWPNAGPAECGTVGHPKCDGDVVIGPLQHWEDTTTTSADEFQNAKTLIKVQGQVKALQQKVTNLEREVRENPQHTGATLRTGTSAGYVGVNDPGVFHIPDGNLRIYTTGETVPTPVIYVDADGRTYIIAPDGRRLYVTNNATSPEQDGSVKTEHLGTVTIVNGVETEIPK